MSHIERTLLIVVAGLLLATSTASAQQVIPIAALRRSTPISFEREVLPILRKSCLACHNQSEAEGGVILETREAMLVDGDAGPVIVPKNGNDSLLLKVASHRAEPVMPPPGNDRAAKPLTPEELGLIKLWIDQGAIGGGGEPVVSPTDWRPLPRGLNPIYAVAVTPDGQFAACGRANQIFIYHVPTGQLVTRLTDPALQEQSGDGRPGVAHRDIVQSLAFNSSGELLASGGFRTVKLWRYPRDVQRQKLTAATDAVAAVAVSPDGKVMATGGVDNSIKVWDTATGENRAQCVGHTAAIRSLRFSHDGSRLISGSADKTIRVWNTTDGSSAGRIDTPFEVTSLTLIQQPAAANPETASPDPAPAFDEWIISGGGDNFIRVWKMPADLPVELAEVPTEPNVLAVSPDKKLLAIAGAAGDVRVVDFESGELIKTWKAHSGAISNLSFQPVKQPPATQPESETPLPAPIRRIATAGADRTVRIWNLDTADELAVLRGTLVPIQSVAFHPTENQLLAGAENGAITAWNLDTAAPVSMETGGSVSATVAALSPNGTLLAVSGTANGQNVILVFDAATGKRLHTLMGHAGKIASLTFSADNTKMVSGAEDKTARVWDLNDAKFPEIATFAGHAGAVTGVAFSADGLRVVSGAADNTLKLWTVADAQEQIDFAGHTAAIVGVALTASNQVISASNDKTIRFWNAADGKQIRAITEPVAAGQLALSRDGAQIAVGLADNNVKLYQVADGRLLQTLIGHQKPVSHLSFSPENTRLLTLGADHQAAVWRVADGRLLELRPIDEGATVAAFGASPTSILLGDATGEVGFHGLHFALSLDGVAQSITAITYRADGQAAFVASADGTVRGFNLANGQQLYAANHGAAVHDLALSPDGARLASAGEDKVVKIWNSANGGAIAPSQVTGFTDAAQSVAFSDDGKQIIAGSSAEAGELLIFDATDGLLEQSLVGHAGGIHSVVSTGDRVVSASADATVRTWNLFAERRIAGHSQPVTSLATIPADPPQLLSGSTDTTVRHWNVITGQLIRQMNHGGPVTAVAARPDGQRFASTSLNNTAKLWNAANGQQLAEMRGDIRAKSLVAELTQQKTAQDAKVASAKIVVDTATKDAPVKAAAAKAAADALAAVEKDVAAKATVLTQAESAKAAAEKLAIEAAAAASKATKAKEAAEELALTMTATAKLLADKAARAQAAATANPADATLSQTAGNALAAAMTADTQAKAATAAVAAPTQAAATAATAANTATTNAVATQKPYNDAQTALRAAQQIQQQAAQAAEIAAREAKTAADFVPASKKELADFEAALAKLVADLDGATKAMAAAEQPIQAVAFSLDNRNLATAGDFQVVHTWDSENGAAVGSYVGHAGPIRSLAYTRDAGIVTGAADKTAIVWEVNPSWRLERTIGGIDDPSLLVNRVTSLDFSNDGTMLCTGGGVPSRSGVVSLWKVEDGSLLREIPDAHTDSVFGVEFSPDGAYVVSGGADKYVRMFEVGTGNLVRQFEGHTDHVLAVSWRADGKLLASCGADNTIKVWDAHTGDRARDIVGFTKQVSSVRFIGQSVNTISCSGDMTVRMHNSDNGQNFRNFGGATDFMYSTDATPDSQIVVAGGYDSVLRIWNGVNGQVLRAIQPPVEPETVAADTATGQPAAN